MNHSTDNLLVCCMDFRFHEATMKHIKENYGANSFDLCTLAGGSQQVSQDVQAGKETLFKEIGIGCNLHHVNRVFLVNHQDCGAYGGSKAFDSLETELSAYKDDLKAAAEKIKSEYPDVEVIRLQVRFDESDKIWLEEVQ